MTDIVETENFRAKPVPVPEGWHAQMLIRKRKIDKDGYNLQEEVGVIKANEILKAEKYTWKKQELLEYFETILSMPDVSEAWEHQIKFYHKSPEGQLPEGNQWGRVTAGFTSWWVCTRHQLNSHNIWSLGVRYKGVGHDALKAYFLSDDVRKAYDVMEDSFKEYIASYGEQK